MPPFCLLPQHHLHHPNVSQVLMPPSCHNITCISEFPQLAPCQPGARSPRSSTWRLTWERTASGAAVPMRMRRKWGGETSQSALPTSNSRELSKKPTGSSTGNPWIWWEFGTFPVEFPVAGFYQVCSQQHLHFFECIICTFPVIAATLPVFGNWVQLQPREPDKQQLLAKD